MIAIVKVNFRECYLLGSLADFIDDDIIYDDESFDKSDTKSAILANPAKDAYNNTSLKRPWNDPIFGIPVFYVENGDSQFDEIHTLGELIDVEPSWYL